MSNRESMNATCDPGTIRQHGGDVLIHLSSRPRDQFLLHRELVAELLPNFRPLLQPPRDGMQWKGMVWEFADPILGQHAPLHILTLSLRDMGSGDADLTWILGGEDASPRLASYRNLRAASFSYSTFADKIARSLHHPAGDQGFLYCREAVVLEYRVLLNMLCVQPAGTQDHEVATIATTNIEPLSKPDGLDEEYVFWDMNRRWALYDDHVGQPLGENGVTDFRSMLLVELLVNVATRAEYHLCLPRVAPQIIAHLSGIPDIWAHVGLQPHFWIGVSQMLRWKDCYGDCIRHLAARHCLHNRLYVLPDLPSFDREALLYPVLAARDELSSGINYLRFQIDAMALTPHPITRVKQRGPEIWFWIRSIFLRPGRNLRRKGKYPFTSNSYKPAKPDRDDQDRIDFIARSVFSHWIFDLFQTSLSTRQGGSPDESRWVPEELRDCCWSIAPFRFWEACQTIRKAAKENDISVFGYEPDKTLSRWFKLVVKGKPAPHLVLERLLELLKDASRIIVSSVRKALGDGQRPVAGPVPYWTFCSDVDDECLPWAGGLGQGGVPGLCGFL